MLCSVVILLGLCAFAAFFLLPAMAGAFVALTEWFVGFFKGLAKLILGILLLIALYKIATCTPQSPEVREQIRQHNARLLQQQKAQAATVPH